MLLLEPDELELDGEPPRRLRSGDGGWGRGGRLPRSALWRPPLGRGGEARRPGSLPSRAPAALALAGEGERDGGGDLDSDFRESRPLPSPAAGERWRGGGGGGGEGGGERVAGFGPSGLRERERLEEGRDRGETVGLAGRPGGGLLSDEDPSRRFFPTGEASFLGEALLLVGEEPPWLPCAGGDHSGPFGDRP